MKNNVAERAIKTFIFAFFGVFVPELCAVLSAGAAGVAAAWPVAVVSVICAALAAGLSATWNYLENWWRSEDAPVDCDFEELE